MRPRTAAQQNQVIPGLSEDAGYRLTGLMIVSIVPALFWTGLLALTGSAFGVLPSPLALGTVGAAIAAFLAAVANALFTKVD